MTNVTELRTSKDWYEMALRHLRLAREYAETSQGLLIKAQDGKLDLATNAMVDRGIEALDCAAWVIGNRISGKRSDDDDGAQTA